MEVIRGYPELVETICALPEWTMENQRLLGALDAEILEISPIELKKISLLNTPNQVLLVLRQPREALNIQALKDDFSLYLDDIRDPGNLGTILRIADWFGVKQVIRSENTVELFNPKVVQASMGAFLRVSSPQVELIELRKHLGDVPIFGAALGGASVFETEIPKASLLVIGNESRGISPSILTELTQSISIPKHEQGGAESLNAAIATGILCAVFRNK